MDIRQVMRRWFQPSERAGAELERRAERKDLLAGYYANLLTGAVTSYQSRPWPVERAVGEAYEKIIWVFKAVEAIADHASRLPFEIRRGEDVVEDHPLLRVLNKRANPMETGPMFRKRLTTQVLLSKKGAFVEVTSSRGGDPIRMDLLPPGRTYPVPGTGGVLIDHFEVLRADGTRQEIETERVRWFRSPHPLDPYSGVTPLEAAGLSIELDFFARLYNVAFLRNDGRPGGIVAIDGEMGEYDMGELRKRFGTGAANAGQLTVVEGQVSYVDIAARPRDMSYEALTKNSKTEILSAFGVGESVIGYAADRTYDNASQELYNFWTVTMPPVLGLLASGFDDDTDDDLECGFDLSEVEVLQRAEIARREEARAEYELGLITIDEYREIAGRDPFDMPRTRALWVPSGKQLVATSDADQKKLDEEALAKLPPALATNALPPGQGGQDGNPPGPDAPNAQRGQNGPPAPQDDRTTGKPPAASAAKALHLSVLPGDGHGTPRTARPVMRLVRETKAARRWAESVPDEAARDRLEVSLAAALTAVGLRLVERTAVRVASPKSRKGTRHWVTEYERDTRVGTKALDAGTAVDPGRWEEETQTATHPIVQAAAVAAAAALLADLGGQDDDVSLDILVTTVEGMVGQAALGMAELIRTAIVAADQDGAPIDVIAETVREHRTRVVAWAQAVAAQSATATVNGARDAAAQALAAAGKTVDKQWRSRLDEKTRPTHRAAHGQRQPLEGMFRVGDALLRYPGDPSGPPHEVYECRCWANHRSLVTGQFVAPPSGRTRYTREEREAEAS